MKNGIIHTLLFLFLGSGSLLSQAGFATLPLLHKSKSASSTEKNIYSGPKYQKALQVYNRLVAARGDRRSPVPTLVLRKEEHRVAQILYDDLVIILEEKAFDVCSSFGPMADAALATLIGHELTHYYEKHAWRRHFISEYQDLSVSLTLNNLTDDITNETQADYLGGFLSYSAGYGLFDQGPSLIGRLYEAYGISSQIDGYPSLQDRQTLSRRTTEKLQRLVEVFDMANLLTATGKYQEAFLYYKYVLQQYQSRELYNNVGVVAVLQALQFFGSHDMPFHLPLELDLESPAARGQTHAKKLRVQLLQEAIKHFDAAISWDPEYAPAYLNKACAYLMLKDFSRAQFYAEIEALQIARKNKNTKVEADVNILLGILAAQSKDTAKAQSILAAVAADGSMLARTNLNILLNKAKPITAVRSPARGIAEERIGTVTMAQVADAPSYDDSKSIQIQKSLSFEQDSGDDPNSTLSDARLFISLDTDQYTYSLFLQTKAGYTGKTALGIGIGAGYADIISAYGQPERTIETPNGQLLVYSKIAFVLGERDTLQRWILYSLDEGS